MSQASEDLRKIVRSIEQKYPALQRAATSNGGVPSPTGRKLHEPVAGGEASVVMLAIGLASCGLLCLTGFLTARPSLVGLGSIGCLAGAAGLGFLKTKVDSLGQGGSDVAVEILKRRSLDLQRRRLAEELEGAHRTNQELNQRIGSLDETVARLEGEKAEAIARKERELRERLDQERELLREEMKSVRTVLRRELLESEKQEISALQQEMTEREKLLEQSLGHEIFRLKEALGSRERKFEELSAETVKLQEALDAQRLAVSARIAEQLAPKQQALEEERESLNRRLRELEGELQKSKALETRLREELERQAAASSAVTAQQEASYRAQLKEQLKEQEDRFSAERTELLSAGEAVLKEIEEHEQLLLEREKNMGRTGRISSLE